MEGKRSRRIWKLSTPGISVLLVSTAIVLTFLAVTPVIAAQEKVEISVVAPDEVKEGETFIATINVDSITNLWFGQFDLSFDPNVVAVTDVKEGKINGDTVPIKTWNLVETNTVRVIIMMPMGEGVNGSGYLAEIVFEVKGEGGDKSNLEISKGKLGDMENKKIDAKWDNAKGEVSIEEEGDGEEEGEPTPTPTLSPTVTPLTNISATPTPVTIVTVTPAPALTPGVTPTPVPAVAATPTIAPGVTPTHIPAVAVTPTPTPKLPGFEAILALAGILAIALRRRGWTARKV